MQIYAKDKMGSISARLAEKQKNYSCPECGQKVRLRGGVERQAHFFHIESKKKCRLAQKGLIHLHVQKFLVHLLEGEEAVMEKFFPEKKRVADVACMKTKKVFEVQYSPISFEEVRQRCADYEDLGFQVIWILHIHQFNKKKMTQAELFLRSKNCYFSNMDAKGSGIIFDQREKLHGSRRKYWGNRTSVNLQKSYSISGDLTLPDFKKNWTLCHEGDVIYHFLKGGDETIFNPSRQRKPLMLKEKYMEWLYMLLERNVK